MFEDACHVKDHINKQVFKKPSWHKSIGKAFDLRKFAQEDTKPEAIKDLIMEVTAFSDQVSILIEDLLVT